MGAPGLASETWETANLNPPFPFPTSAPGGCPTLDISRVRFTNAHPALFGLSPVSAPSTPARQFWERISPFVMAESIYTKRRRLRVRGLPTLHKLLATMAG